MGVFIKKSNADAKNGMRCCRGFEFMLNMSEIQIFPLRYPAGWFDRWILTAPPVETESAKFCVFNRRKGEHTGKKPNSIRRTTLLN